MRKYILLIFMFCTVSVVSCQAQSQADRNRDPNGSVVAIEFMKSHRAAHTATLLSDNKVLIAGGFVNGGDSIATTEIYDAAIGKFLPAPNMSVARAGHSATKLKNGKILIAGGFNGDYLNSAEIFDPSTNSFLPAGKMVVARSGHVATLLNDGTVLLAGGVSTGWTFLASAEIYDPNTNSFTPTSSMMTERESHTASLLNDGRVLITGGHKGRRAAIIIYRSAEIYDPNQKTFSQVGDLTTKRHKHEAIVLGDGRVLVIGGSDEQDGAGAYRHCEIYDPQTKTFSPVTRPMAKPRYKLQGTVVNLPDGRILIAGGSDQAEIFDPKNDKFQLVNGTMGSNRLFSSATLLGNGTVLIVGGYHTGSNNVSNGAWIYKL